MSKNFQSKSTAFPMSDLGTCSKGSAVIYIGAVTRCLGVVHCHLQKFISSAFVKLLAQVIDLFFRNIDATRFQSAFMEIREIVRNAVGGPHLSTILCLTRKGRRLSSLSKTSSGNGPINSTHLYMPFSSTSSQILRVSYHQDYTCLFGSIPSKDKRHQGGLKLETEKV